MKVALNTVRSALSCFRCSRFSFAAAASAGQYFMTRAAFCVSRASLLGAIFINPDPSRCPFGTGKRIIYASVYNRHTHRALALSGSHATNPIRGAVEMLCGDGCDE
jgi:hypothetical protein